MGRTKLEFPILGYNLYYEVRIFAITSSILCKYYTPGMSVDF